MKIGSLKIFKQEAGVISEEPVWVCIESCWLYIDKSLFRLLVKVWKEWRNDRHIVG